MPSPARRSPLPALLLPLLLAAPPALLGTGCTARDLSEPAPTALDETFDTAARDFDVPRDVLVSVSYALTRLDDRAGMEAVDSSVGLMGLHADGTAPSVERAAELLNQDPDDVAMDPVLNIRGAAAILRSWAEAEEQRTGEPVDELREWFPLVARYSGAEDPMVALGFANQVYDFMQWGFMAEAITGDFIEVGPHQFPWRDDKQAVAGSSLITSFIPASSSNYTNDSRTSASQVVIHTMEGSYSGAISWFQNSAAGASAHYMVRSSDGEITQMVDEEDTAWHAGHWETNQASIGIEHEGFVSDPDRWYTDAMYRASAALTADICDRYGIPKDRDHIIGHWEVPGCSNPKGGGSSCHTDPGDGWDWDYYMELVRGEAGGDTGLESMLSDGMKTGRFEVEAVASRTGARDTCSGRLEGSATGGNLYLTASCISDTRGVQAGELRISWNGTAIGDRISGTVVADGYSDPWEGTIAADGSLTADIAGSHELGGEIGTLSYSARIQLDP